MSMLLQHYCPERATWITLGQRFEAAQAEEVQARAARLAQDLATAWRVVRADASGAVLSVFNGRRWQAVAEAEPATEPMPWFQSSLQSAYERLRSRRTERDYATTIPIDRRDR